MTFRMMNRIAAVFLMMFACAGCDQNGRGPDVSKGQVMLLAAASTSDAVTELARMFQAQTGIQVKISTGGSNALASQILAGVPGDVFLSANARWAAAVVEHGFTLENKALLSNRLVLVTPLDNPAHVHGPEDLLSKAESRVALAGETVPAGIYAGQALAAAGSGGGVYDALVAAGRIARGQDVRLTLGYVETGEAQAGVVYATDARVSSKVRVVYEFDASMADQIVYPLLLLKPARENPAGREFYEYLSSPAAMAVFEKYGFHPAHAKVDSLP